ncbi:TetR/AcrR family transcriptional regulator [Roseobacter denitrificans]|uniref:TetR/AcrR family transcriptional regulator n=2 Tax=Roseobacter denitrificans TaxID=2434 RepID=UPI00032180BF|nr:TetR family transcriptional regulator [Roseobacter denitrificans]AVL51577.1 TetR/AcrR family transcriptional regulator [Roseobacter denitrificans]SFF76712.1 transcriptional regulator, TetR family [Roseobacter denitrificans OCh 114]
MPRMSQADKQKSHERILDAAARLFRRDGISATSVSDVMQAAGLTQGGFYRHFSSKEDLVAAAFERSAEELLTRTKGKTESQKRADYIARYLSLSHVKNAGQGCPFAANGSEVTKLGDGLRSQACQAIKRISTMLNASEDKTAGDGVATLALLVGTITLARLAQSDAEATQIVEAGKVAVDRLSNKTP